MDTLQMQGNHFRRQVDDEGLSQKYDMAHSSLCLHSPHCSTQVNLSSVLTAAPDQITPPPAIHHKIFTVDEGFVIIYPAQLKRPPKISTL